MSALRQAHQCLALTRTPIVTVGLALSGADAEFGAAITPSRNLIPAVAVSGAASFGLWVQVCFAQQVPRQPSATAVPQQPIRSPLTVKCPNGDSYVLTTGNNEGLCKVYVNLGTVIGGLCTDGSNSALQSCSTGCQQVQGSGGCEKKDPTGTGEATPNGT